MRLRRGLAGPVGTGTARRGTDPRFTESRGRAKAGAPPPSCRLPPARGIGTRAGFLPLPPRCSLKSVSGFARASGALSFLASSRGLNILFLFAFLTVRCLPRASHKPSDASKSGFPSLCAWAGALAQPLPMLFPQADL